MTPEEAARILGVVPGASAAEVVAAFARAARSTHPDRFAGASAEVLATASASFVEATRARDVLLANRIATPNSTPAARFDGLGRQLFVPPYVEPPAPRGPWPTRVWIVLLLGTSVLAAVSGAVPFPWSLLVLVPLDVATILYTRRRHVLALRCAVFFTALFAVLTAVLGSYIPLVILAFVLGCVIALIVLARR